MIEIFLILSMSSLEMIIMNKASIRNLLILTTLLTTPLFADGEMFTLESSDMFEMSFSDLMEVEISSADKIATPIKDIAASVTIVTRAEIEKYGYRTLPHILKNIPGLYMMDDTERLHLGVRGNSGGGLQFLINGITVHPSLAIALTSTDRNKFNIPVGSIDRIEVVRGPMSVMYGNNAFFGIVNIITNDISQEDGLVSVSKGDNNNDEFFIRYGKKNKDGFFVLNVGSSKDDGIEGKYSDMMSASELSSHHSDSVSSMKKEMSYKNKSFDISTKYKDLIANISYKTNDYGFYPTMPGLGEDNTIEMTTKQLSLEYSTAITNTISLKAVGIFSDEKYNISSLSFVQPSAGGTQTQGTKRDEFELNLIYKKKDFEVLAGYKYLKQSDIFNDVCFTIAPNTPFLDQEIYIDDIETHELFSQISYKLKDDITVIGGFRYLRLPNYYNTTIVDFGVAENKIYKIKEDYRTTGRLALLYAISKSKHIKFLLGSAVYENTQLGNITPEEIKTYEINYLSSYDKFQFSSNLFYNDIESIKQVIHNVADENQTTSHVTSNDGRWKSVGLELIGKYNITDDLNINGSATIQDTKNMLYKDEDVEYSPKLLTKFKIDYRYKKFDYALNTTYVSKMKTSFSENELARVGNDVDGYFLTDINIKYNIKKNIYTNLNISNIFDEKYYYPTRGVANMSNGLIGMQRVSTVTFGYKF